MRRSWQHWLRVCVVALTVPVLTMGPAWAGRGLFRCHRKRCRPVCYHAVTCCPTPCETDCTACEPIACCEVADAEIAHAPIGFVEEATLGGIEIPSVAESVVAQPTRPDASTVAEAVPPLTPAAPVEPASVETPAPPAPAAELEAELAELKSELSDLKTGMKADLEAGLSQLKSEMKTEMSQLKGDLKSELSELKTGMKSDLETELEELKNKLESQPKPEPQPAAPQPPARPAEDNIFEEGKGGSSYEAFRDAEDARKPAMNESSQPETPASNAAPSQPAVKPAEPDSPLPLPEIPAPSLEEPAVPAPATPAPVPAPVIDDPFSALPPEPVRRWLDDSGSHDTVGQLVEVHPDRVRIRKLNGRFTTVAISRLSAADKNYVTATGERLAAKPRLTDTAGM